MYIKPQYVREVYTNDGEIVLFNPLSGKLALVSNKLAHQYKERIVDGKYNLNNKELIDSFFIQEGNFIDEKAIVESLRQSVINPNYLHLTIMPTEQCNFRCIYCYETFKKGKMDLSTAKAIVAYVRKEIYKYSGVLISWFGGEPLLAMDIIEYISNAVLSICREHKKNYLADMTTNGYLLSRNIVEKLYKLRVFKYQITLDGYVQTHDKQRILCSGAGTFHTIVNNILDIKNNFRKKFLGITIRTNLTNEIINSSIEDYIDFIKNYLIGDEMIDFRFRVAWRSESSAASDVFISSEMDAYKYVFSLLKDINGLNLLGELKEMMAGGGVCYAAKKNNFVIGSDGAIYMCTVHFDDDKNRIGNISEDGEFVIDNSKLSYWTIPEELNSDCEKCASKMSCLGIGCPYNHEKRLACNAVNDQYDLLLSQIIKNRNSIIIINEI